MKIDSTDYLSESFCKAVIYGNKKYITGPILLSYKGIDGNVKSRTFTLVNDEYVNRKQKIYKFLSKMLKSEKAKEIMSVSISDKETSKIIGTLDLKH